MTSESGSKSAPSAAVVAAYELCLATLQELECDATAYARDSTATLLALEAALPAEVHPGEFDLVTSTSWHLSQLADQSWDHMEQLTVGARLLRRLCSARGDPYHDSVNEVTGCLVRFLGLAKEKWLSDDDARACLTDASAALELLAAGIKPKDPSNRLQLLLSNEAVPALAAVMKRLRAVPAVRALRRIVAGLDNPKDSLSLRLPALLPAMELLAECNERHEEFGLPRAGRVAAVSATSAVAGAGAGVGSAAGAAGESKGDSKGDSRSVVASPDAGKADAKGDAKGGSDAGLSSAAGGSAGTAAPAAADDDDKDEADCEGMTEEFAVSLCELAGEFALRRLEDHAADLLEDTMEPFVTAMGSQSDAIAGAATRTVCTALRGRADRVENGWSVNIEAVFRHLLSLMRRPGAYRHCADIAVAVLEEVTALLHTQSKGAVTSTQSFRATLDVMAAAKGGAAEAVVARLGQALQKQYDSSAAGAEAAKSASVGEAKS